MNWGIKGDERGSECGKRRREVKKKERCFTLLPSLLHPVLINTEALKKMSARTECVCACVHRYAVYTHSKIVYLFGIGPCRQVGA